MKKLTPQTVAEMIYDAALNRFSRSHKVWLGDVQMMKVQTADYLDIIKIANLVNNEQIKEAAKAMFNLDTEVRDDIPDKAYNWVADNSANKA